jgi:sulfatase maturation enzyme AslB (radical SAM superfamily)
MMNNKDGSRDVAPAAKNKAAKKEENWMEICKDCKVLKLEMGCGFGCEMTEESLRRKRKNVYD